MGRVSNTDAPPLRFRNDEDFSLYRPAGRPLPVRFAPPRRKFRRMRRAKRRVATLSLRELPVKAGQEAMPVALAARDTIVRALSRCADSAGQSRPLAKRDVRSIFSAKMRRGGRVVEGARLESVYAGNRIAGSNPAPSATISHQYVEFVDVCGIQMSMVLQSVLQYEAGLDRWWVTPRARPTNGCFRVARRLEGRGVPPACEGSTSYFVPMRRSRVRSI